MPGSGSPCPTNNDYNDNNKLFDAFFWIRPSRPNDKAPFNSTEVLWHYPADVSATTKEFRDIPQFCFPDLARMKLESPLKARVEHYTFTLTDSTDSPVALVSLEDDALSSCCH